jgi:hypothetical protein
VIAYQKRLTDFVDPEDLYKFIDADELPTSAPEWAVQNYEICFIDCYSVDTLIKDADIAM